MVYPSAPPERRSRGRLRFVITFGAVALAAALVVVTLLGFYREVRKTRQAEQQQACWAAVSAAAALYADADGLSGDQFEFTSDYLRRCARIANLQNK